MRSHLLWCVCVCVCVRTLVGFYFLLLAMASTKRMDRPVSSPVHYGSPPHDRRVNHTSSPSIATTATTATGGSGVINMPSSQPRNYHTWVRGYMGMWVHGYVSMLVRGYVGTWVHMGGGCVRVFSS